MDDDTIWTELPAPLSAKLLAYARGGLDEATGAVPAGAVRGAMARLPFYIRTMLLRFETGVEPLYALWDQATHLFPLDGTGDPVHAANRQEAFRVHADNAAPYIRFFSFAVRGPEGAFVLLESPSDVLATALGDRAAEVVPLEPMGTDDQGRLLFRGTMAYDDGLYRVLFAAGPDGEVQMVEDTLVASDFEEGVLPAVPDLGRIVTRDQGAPRTAVKLENMFERLEVGPTKLPDEELEAPAGAPLGPGRPTLTVLVELLLERALHDRARHRLFERFNATRTEGNALDQFTALLTNAFPVVCVESGIPFVEETIAKIVMARLTDEPPVLARARVGPDESALTVSIPESENSLVLLPLQVYRRVVDTDRLAYDLAVRNAAAVVACNRFDDLPDALRSLVDVTLELPPLDGAIFRELFERVMGTALPSGWDDDGAKWTKYVLHSDFEQPRRLGLGAKAAFQYVRERVTERLGSVETGDALGLSQLHGLGEARSFAEDLISDIHAAIRGEIPWSHVDRGALLVGPPGTGKTTLARAIAKDCGVRFTTASATEWQAASDHLGQHLAAISKTFAEARTYAPSILFIDEIDSLGSRERLTGQGAHYQLEVVNAVLEQMQELDPSAPVFVVAATNHEDRVDPALRRSGRLDRVIHIPRPNSEALTLIYDHYLALISEHQEIAPDVDTGALGGLSLGLTGADLERVVRGAARRARKDRTPLGQHHLFAEITGKPRDPSQSRRLTPEEIERVAYHEAGHALAMFLSRTRGDDIGYVSVVPRADGSLGFVMLLPDRRASLTRADYDELIGILLAGRAAEELRFGDVGVSGGASSDLRMATGVATGLITKLGLGSPRSLVWTETLSNDQQAMLDRLLDAAYEQVVGTLEEQKHLLDRLAVRLIEVQELSGDAVRELFSADPNGGPSEGGGESGV